MEICLLAVCPRADKQLQTLASDHQVCHRLVTVPGSDRPSGWLCECPGLLGLAGEHERLGAANLQVGEVLGGVDPVEPGERGGAIASMDRRQRADVGGVVGPGTITAGAGAGVGRQP